MKMKMQQVGSFANSLYNHMRNGLQNASLEDQNKRMSECENCDKFIRESITCGECGCFLLIKTSWASEKCPLDKWQATNPAAPPPPMNPAGGDCGCNKKNV